MPNRHHVIASPYLSIYCPVFLLLLCAVSLYALKGTFKENELLYIVEPVELMRKGSHARVVKVRAEQMSLESFAEDGK